MFLTPAELQKLTGYKRRASQLAWLRKRGVEPFVSAKGELLVFPWIIEEAQRRASGMNFQQVTRSGPRPNLRAVR